MRTVAITGTEPNLRCFKPLASVDWQPTIKPLMGWPMKRHSLMILAKVSVQYQAHEIMKVDCPSGHMLKKYFQVINRSIDHQDL